ncbi:MAG TPA: UvrD-helicase domain-containing protein [Chthoniobacterales bacterium]
MNKIADADARDRFAQDLEQNFSVVASAGSGKTRAITDRIVELAQKPGAMERLPQLVVVTYTNRAADEMQQRTRQRILEAGLPLEIVEAFNRAFFGTIHSFCVKLLATHGHYLGLPGNLELMTDDEDLWNQFVQQQTTVGRSLGGNRRALLRHVQVRQLMELARQCEPELSAVEPDCCCPDTDFSEVHAAVAKGAATRTIPKDQENLRRWEERWRGAAEFAPWPPRSSNAGEFVRRWRDAFRPVREWVNRCALCVAAEVQRAYRDFRFERGVVTYADQISLAVELLRRPEVVRRIREKNYRVILDEAQDTDPQQFLVLLEITRPPEASGIWRDKLGAPPRPGHFCMVGDFQQSIYREPAELARYRELHDLLIAQGAADELKFSVTFRLDRAQLEFVNQTFPAVLNGEEDQVDFVELNARPGILPGQVIGLDFEREVDLNLREMQRATQAARLLAEWLRKQSPEKLRAELWRDVAILAPRKAWLRLLRDALIAEGLPVEVHSEAEMRAENPAYAWLTALLAIMVEPSASYQIVGVLREVFGLSDEELARFAEGEGSRFQVLEKTSGRGPVPDLLNRLARIRLTIAQQPLFSAIQEVVRMTQLRERLRTLPPETFPELSADLEKLLSAAATAEARGDSLAGFAHHLRTNYRTVRESNPPTANAIQLITAQKAKGSEWQAVIVPFLTRNILGPALRYPRLLQSPEADEPQIVFDKSDADEHKDAVERAERQEMERLLYVALTRAKHTLVLAADRRFFEKKLHGGIHSHTQLRWLCADTDQPNESIFSSLPDEPTACAETSARQQMIGRTDTHEDFGERELGWIDRARQHAARFCRTVSPSKFAPIEESAGLTTEDVWLEVEPELRPPRIDNPATRYGVWWHDFVRQIPWLAEAATWNEVFDLERENALDPSRAAREWRLLRDRIPRVSEFAGNWPQAPTMMRAEWPFFWKMRDDRCLEGVIDLAFFDSAAKAWLIIDWKTNRIARNKLEELRAQYRPQLAAYRQVVMEITGHQVSAALYSTANGEFVRYGEAELAAEWARLERLAPEELFAELNESERAGNRA